MSEQDLDYSAIRRNIEKGVSQQKWIYRIIFFAIHMLFFLITMLVMWGYAMTDPQLRDILFGNESGAAVIVILPTVMWASVLFFHIASLFVESSAGEKSMRERLLMREIGEDILRKAYEDGGLADKPKRRATKSTMSDAMRVLLSDDGELVEADADEQIEQRDNNVRSNHAGK